MNHCARLAAMALFFFASANASAGVASAAPLTSDQAVFVERTRLLERDPFTANAREIRQWLLTWTKKAPEVSVTVCDVLGPIPKQKVPYGSELLLQSMFGNAAFQLEHPDRKTDMQAMQLAGMDSLLKAYAAIVALHPEAAIPYFDGLRKQQALGKLGDALRPVVAKNCRKS
jgi:hypothetical protein